MYRCMGLQMKFTVFCLVVPVMNFNLCHKNLSVPITCKIRVFPDVEKTVRYAKMLEAAGCQLLTVHGRNRDQKGMNTGLADWNQIKAVKEALKIPVFANGNIQCLDDVHRCLKETGVDGVMTAEGNLHNPALFEGLSPPIWQVAEEYLHIVKENPCPLSYYRGHIYKLFHHFLHRHVDVRELLKEARTVDEVLAVVSVVKKVCLEADERYKSNPDNHDAGDLPLPYWICQPYVRPSPLELEKRQQEKAQKRQLEDEQKPEKDVFLNGVKLSKKQIKRLKKNPHLKFGQNRRVHKICEKESCGNPMGQKCVNMLCRACCKVMSYHQSSDCAAHRLKMSRNQPAKSSDVEKHCDGSVESISRDDDLTQKCTNDSENMLENLQANGGVPSDTHSESGS